MALSQLAGKWVLVTGAASGIGLETARAFARRRSNVIVPDINETALDPIQREIEAMSVGTAPNLSAYCASKHAVMGLSDTLAMELAGTKVGITIVCPGVIDTPIVRNRRAVADVVPEAQMEKIDAHYKKTGAHPSVVGERIVKAVQRGEDLVFVGPTARALYNAKRVSRKLARTATLAACKANGYGWPYPQS